MFYVTLHFILDILKIMRIWILILENVDFFFPNKQFTWLVWVTFIFITLSNHFLPRLLLKFKHTAPIHILGAVVVMSAIWVYLTWPVSDLSNGSVLVGSLYTSTDHSWVQDYKDFERSLSQASFSLSPPDTSLCHEPVHLLDLLVRSSRCEVLPHLGVAPCGCNHLQDQVAGRWWRSKAVGTPSCL
jgi:hypothetical protein